MLGDEVEPVGADAVHGNGVDELGEGGGVLGREGHRRLAGVGVVVPVEAEEAATVAVDDHGEPAALLGGEVVLRADAGQGGATGGHDRTSGAMCVGRNGSTHTLSTHMQLYALYARYTYVRPRTCGGASRLLQLGRAEDTSNRSHQMLTLPYAARSKPAGSA